MGKNNASSDLAQMHSLFIAYGITERDEWCDRNLKENINGTGWCADQYLNSNTYDLEISEHN